MHGIAFAELVVFLEDMSGDEDSAAVFRLSDLAKLYKDRLEQLESLWIAGFIASG